MIEQGWTLYFICLNVLCIMNNEYDVEESIVFKNQNIFFFKIQNDKKNKCIWNFKKYYLERFEKKKCSIFKIMSNQFKESYISSARSSFSKIQ